MNSPNSCHRLDGRVAMISGGAHGIGRAIAELFQRECAHVLIADYDSKQGQVTANELSKLHPTLP